MLKNGERPLNAEEREFFHGLYKDHYQALFVCACQLGIGREAAEDYVQDAFMMAIRHIDEIKKSRNPRGYLRQALKYVIGYQLRSLRYAIKLQKKLQDDLGHAQDEGDSDALQIETLYQGAIRDEELRLLIRFYLDGWPQRDLAEELEISEEACKKRIRRAKERLRSALQEEDKPPGPEIPGSKDSVSTEGGPEQQ